MKQLCQLNNDCYFVGVTNAEESPLEPGVFHIPAGCIDVDAPDEIENKKVKWVNSQWVYEDIPEPEVIELTYAQNRAKEYPLITDYLDGIVKGNQAQIDKYIADCLAVKTKYPKPE